MYMGFNKNILKFRLYFFIVLFVLLVPINSFALERNYVEGEYIVKYKNSENKRTLNNKKQKLENVANLENIEIKESFEDLNLLFIKTENIENKEEVLSFLSTDLDIEYIEPNYIRTINTFDIDDTYKDLLWALHNTGQEIDGDAGAIAGTTDADIDMPEAWSISEGAGSNIVVAVIDNGVAYTHPDLINNMWDGVNCKSDTGVFLGDCLHGYDFFSNDKDPLPALNNNHGTHVAGIIGAVKNNALGVAGVAPNVKIMAIRAGTGSTITLANLIKAINFARENGAHIINASFGGAGFSQAEYDAIEAFGNSGGLLVAAAGNSTSSNDENPIYPASYDLLNIISVGATDQNDEVASFSNYGESVDIGAPGVNIYSTFTGDAFAFASGTSMSTPFVAGLAGLLWGYQESFSFLNIKNLILDFGEYKESLNAFFNGGKRINALRSLFGANILDAENIYEASVVGEAEGQYTLEVKNIFREAIDVASAVIENVLSSDEEILLASGVLSEAKSTFESSANVAIEEEEEEPPVEEEIIEEEEELEEEIIEESEEEIVEEEQEEVPVVVPRRGGGGGGGGGGSFSPAPVAVAINTELPLENLPIVGPVVFETPSDCQIEYLFSPSTGAPCRADVVPVRYLFTNENTNNNTNNTNITINKNLCVVGSTLRQGSRGEDVKCMQRILGIKDDGVFGAQTKGAVMSFQRKNNLTADGIVGPKTRVFLNR
jgi:subtilisin family serine protease